MAREGRLTGWVKRLFARAEPTRRVEPRDWEDFEPADGVEPLSVATRGNVFDFHVVPHFRWRGQMSWDRLRDRALDLDANARGELLRRCWGPAREFDPQNPVGFETHMNKEFREGWCYGHDERLVKCLPTIRVRVDPALRDHVRPFAVRRAESGEAHEAAKLRARHTEELTEVWLKVIQKLERLPELGAAERQLLVPFAAALADSEFAAVMEGVRGMRRTGTVALAEVLQLATHNFESVGLYEFAKAYDAMHQAFRIQMGLGPYDPFLAVNGMSMEPPA